MLFSSLGFIFIYLPIVLSVYYLLLKIGLHKWVFAFLVIASFVFYSVWYPPYSILLVGSVLSNYYLSVIIAQRRLAQKSTSIIVTLGVLANVCLLGWYKYANFFVDNINFAAGTNFHLDKIILPLAISFYTIQQIAYLVDVSRGQVAPSGIWRYATFVVFFPQLIAGPIVHYREMMPQFFGRKIGRFPLANLLIGLTIFAIGLFKKTVIADTAATFSTPVYDAVASGQVVDFFQAWRAGICYTIQLYFDFSGYSDMAIGLARMFGIKLPVNFHSPLRAVSIIEYWRRWHITLQRFIASYMYQPLVMPLARFSANRGFAKWPNFFVTVALPTFLIFIVVGFWHGAEWTFVVFGAMHGLYLATNEFWRALWRKRRKKKPVVTRDIVFYRVLTIVCVIAANVVFRAESVADAMVIWQGMLNFGQVLAIVSTLPFNTVEVFTEPFTFVLLSACLIAFFPNTQQIMSRAGPVIEWSKWKSVAPPVIALKWRLNTKWAIFTGVTLFWGIAFISRGQLEFIYFNF